VDQSSARQLTSTYAFWPFFGLLWFGLTSFRTFEFRPFVVIPKTLLQQIQIALLFKHTLCCLTPTQWHLARRSRNKRLSVSTVPRISHICSLHKQQKRHSSRKCQSDHKIIQSPHVSYCSVNRLHICWLQIVYIESGAYNTSYFMYIFIYANWVLYVLCPPLLINFSFLTFLFWFYSSIYRRFTNLP
jgi:hypothetical protein